MIFIVFHFFVSSSNNFRNRVLVPRPGRNTHDMICESAVMVATSWDVGSALPAYSGNVYYVLKFCIGIMMYIYFLGEFSTVITLYMMDMNECVVHRKSLLWVFVFFYWFSRMVIVFCSFLLVYICSHVSKLSYLDSVSETPSSRLINYEVFPP